MMQSKPLRTGICAIVLCATGLLAGCASTLTARVTRFNQWPVDTAGASYRFTPADPPRALELQAYQNQVGTELQQLGLRPADAGKTARFTVDVQAERSEKQRQWRVPVYSDPWVYAPPWRDAQGRLHGGQWVPDPLGARYLGDRTVTRMVQASQLKLHIREAGPDGSERTVFEAIAVHEGSEADLAEVVPYLVRGTFQEFPGANGQVRRLSFDLPHR